MLRFPDEQSKAILRSGVGTGVEVPEEVLGVSETCACAAVERTPRQSSSCTPRVVYSRDLVVDVVVVVSGGSLPASQHLTFRFVLNKCFRGLCSGHGGFAALRSMKSVRGRHLYTWLPYPSPSSASSSHLDPAALYLSRGVVYPSYPPLAMSCPPIAATTPYVVPGTYLPTYSFVYTYLVY